MQSNGEVAPEQSFADLIVKDLSEKEQKHHLADGGQIAITLRIPKNQGSLLGTDGIERHEFFAHTCEHA